MPLARYDGCVLDNAPRPVPGAYISVLTQPTSSVNPPGSPAASIFADPDGDVALSNPFRADGNANYFFYAAQGTYTIIIYGGTLAEPVVLPDQAIGTPAAGLALKINGSSASSQSTQNLISGSGVTVSDGGSGNITIASSGSGVTFKTNHTTNSSQVLLDLVSGTGISLTESAGAVTIAGTAAATFETNSTPNGSQSILNLVGAAHTGIVITDGGSGTISFVGTPVYDGGSSTQLITPKIIKGRASLTNGQAVVTLPIAFASSSAYEVALTAVQAFGASLAWQAIDASSFTIYAIGPTCAVTNVALTSNVLTIDCNSNFRAGEVVLFSGIATATFLNGQSVTIDTADGGTFTAAFTHGDYMSASDTGNVVTINATQVSWTAVGR